jgi:hypothetical protein
VRAHPLELQFHGTSHSAELEQVGDHAGNAVDLDTQLPVVALTVGRSSTSPSSSDSAIARMLAQRRTQVVAHPGHQLAASLLEHVGSPLRVRQPSMRVVERAGNRAELSRPW